MREWPIPEECFDVDNGKLMDWVAECTIEVIREHHMCGVMMVVLRPPINSLAPLFWPNACAQPVPCLQKSCLSQGCESPASKEVSADDLSSAVMPLRNKAISCN